MVIETLRQALSRKSESSTTIIHSDMGSQYTSHDYHIYLHKNNLTASMSKHGTPIDNSPIQSFFSTIKAEWLNNPIHMTIAEIGFEIDEYINFFNNERIQLKTGKAPAVVRARAA